MKKLIVNADDFGLSPGVNRAILHGVAQGGITAASLMVNMPFAEDAAAQIMASCPNLSVALHFCLTSGRAVLPQKAIPALVDAGGYFKPGFLGLWRGLTSYKTRTDVLAQASAEWDAQLERMERFVEKYSLRFDHLDSHQHIHVLPGLLELCEREAEKRRLILRIPREPFGDCRRVLRRFASWFPGGLARKVILDHHLRRSRRDRPTISDHPTFRGNSGSHTEQQVGYFGILDTGQVGLAAFREIVRVIRNDQSGCEIFELNIHPAIDDNDLPEEDIRARNEEPLFSKDDAAFQRSPWRKQECELVNSPEFTRLLAENNIFLASFATI